MKWEDPHAPNIGVFDSGVGGLSVLRAIIDLIPDQGIVYLADQAHVPYGSRSLGQVRHFSEEITQHLLDLGVKLIVVACNTASAAALYHLRYTFPQISFVGMEPAIKPAAEYSHTRVVGVLATPATFQGVLYASVVERFASDVTIHTHTCPGLVENIEDGNLTGLETRNILEDALIPMVSNDVDTIVLGCTHYPFVIPLIQQIVGPEIMVIDPAPAIARQVSRVLNLNDNRITQQDAVSQEPSSNNITFLTTGDPQRFQKQLAILLHRSDRVNQISWDEQNVKLLVRRAI
jgi:glutamate racemase